jgi:hypothetical protein
VSGVTLCYRPTYAQAAVYGSNKPNPLFIEYRPFGRLSNNILLHPPKRQVPIFRFQVQNAARIPIPAVAFRFPVPSSPFPLFTSLVK